MLQQGLTDKQMARRLMRKFDDHQLKEAIIKAGFYNSEYSQLVSNIISQGRAPYTWRQRYALAYYCLHDPRY